MCAACPCLCAACHCLCAACRSSLNGQVVDCGERDILGWSDYQFVGITRTVCGEWLKGLVSGQLPGGPIAWPPGSRDPTPRYMDNAVCVFLLSLSRTCLADSRCCGYFRRGLLCLNGNCVLVAYLHAVEYKTFLTTLNFNFCVFK